MVGSEEGDRASAAVILGPGGEAMTAQAARLQLFEYARDLLCVGGLDGLLRLVNPAWQRELGWEEDEVVGRPWLDFVHEDDRPATEAAKEQLARGLEVLGFENRYRRRDGSYVWLAWNTYPVSSTGLVFAVARNVNSQRETEAALRRSREDYRILFEGMLDGFSYHEMIFDEEGNPADYRFLAVNPAFEAQTGLKAADIIGKRVLEVLPGTERHWIESFGQVARTGTPMRFENYSREFEKYFECLAFQPRPGQFACTFHDVTARTRAEQERTRLQAQFLQAQKMESLGVLTGGIAHDFNNILTAVVVGAERARSALPSAHAAVAEIDIIAGAAERLAELCRQMLAYAGKSRLVAQPADLSEVVTGMRQLLEVSVSKKCVLGFELAERIPAADMDATQIRQLVLNLVINASDALDVSGGHVVVRTGSRHFTDLELLSPVLPATEARAAGTYVFLEVEDDGCGMDAETLARIFDPFFTTKFAGRGLGLAATLGIVRGHRGTIQVRSEVGRGTLFRIFVPAPPGPAARTVKTPNPRPARYSGIVLLADDDRLVRRLTERQLRMMGFEVVSAADGTEAVDLFRSDPDRVRLCILDMTMPGLSGSQVAESLFAIRADLPIVLFSGYGEEEALSLMTRGPRFAFLAKPFTHAELERAVAEALGESSS